MSLYNDQNKNTTVKGLRFKDKSAAKNTIKIVDSHFKKLKEKQKIPGHTPDNLLPRRYLSNRNELRDYYNTQAMYRILAMRNRAYSMLDRTENEDSIDNLSDAVDIFDDWLDKYKKISGGKSVKDCCKHTSKDKKCKRKSDNKVFSLPRRFSRERCLSGPVRGFTMRSSCAPYIDC